MVHWLVLIPPAALMSARNWGVDHQPTSLRQVTFRLFSSPISTGVPSGNTWSSATLSSGHARAEVGAPSVPAANRAAPPSVTSRMKLLRSMLRPLPWPDFPFSSSITWTPSSCVHCETGAACTGGRSLGAHLLGALPRCRVRLLFSTPVVAAPPALSARPGGSDAVLLDDLLDLGGH